MNIYDIARQSGVSIATVSRVLNGSPNVSAKTREKVKSVMEKEEYIPNVFARGLGLNSMKMIGILCTDVSDTFYAKAVSLMEGRLRKYGFDILLSCTGINLEDKKKALGLLLQKRVDAVLLIGSPFKEALDNSHIESAAKQVPVVIINGLVELPNVYCVLCDERDAIYRNIKLLHAQGHNRILYLYDTLTFSGYQKIAGYRAGMQECDITVDENLLVRVEKDISVIETKVSRLISQGLDFSAVMAAEDLIAIGAQKALQKAGKDCPIIGFNNSIIAQCASPALTSIDNMLETLCPTAVNHLVNLINGRVVPQKSVISSRLVERDTFHINNTKLSKESSL